MRGGGRKNITKPYGDQVNYIVTKTKSSAPPPPPTFLAIENERSLIFCACIGFHSYLLRDAKKSTKCRTKTRKGKDPLWNEQFLIVGVNYHDIKRRALEVCIADGHFSSGKKEKLFGGVRLSLGYKAVVAAQTKQVNQVLRFLKGKEAMSGDVNSSFGKWKRASGRKPVADDTGQATEEERNEGTETIDTPGNANKVDEKSVVTDMANGKDESEETKQEIDENGPQSASSASTEVMATDPVPDPSQDEAKANNTRNRLAEQRLFEAVMASIKHLELAARQTVTQSESSEEQDKGLEEKLEKQESPEISTQSINNGADEGNNDSQEADTSDPTPNAVETADESTRNESWRRNSLDTTKNSKSKNVQEKNILNEDQTQRCSDQAEDLLNVIKNHIADRENLPTNEPENSRTEPDQISNGHKGNEDQCTDERSATKEESFPKKGLNPTDTKTDNSVEIPKEEPKHYSKHPTQEIKTENPESENSLPQKSTILKKSSAGGPNDMKRSSSFTLKDIGKRLSFRRSSKSEVSGDSRLETGLQTNADKMMLDAQGLEITQWTLVVSRPKEWHYCWHILRSEMTILH